MAVGHGYLPEGAYLSETSLGKSGTTIPQAQLLEASAEHARLMMPEVRIGIANDVGTIMLSKLLPRQKALEILMTGRQFSAHELATLGLVNEVVPAEEIREFCERNHIRLFAFFDSVLRDDSNEDSDVDVLIEF